MTPVPDGERAPWAFEPRVAAITCFVVVAILGYALQRLWASIGEPDPRTLGPSVHTAYYWRIATALWWGGLAAIGGWRFPVAGPVAARALPIVLVAAAIAAFLVP
ncbi:MAG: hypothetical protein Q8P41_18655 [Pseudomonadota bacterium]|nr:hypothetical protein [Pseudomonadota bacterium]